MSFFVLLFFRHVISSARDLRRIECVCTNAAVTAIALYMNLTRGRRESARSAGSIFQASGMRVVAARASRGANAQSNENSVTPSIRLYRQARTSGLSAIELCRQSASDPSPSCVVKDGVRFVPVAERARATLSARESSRTRRGAQVPTARRVRSSTQRGNIPGSSLQTSMYAFFPAISGDVMG